MLNVRFFFAFPLCDLRMFDMLDGPASFYIRFSSYFPIDFVRLSNRCPRIVLSIFIPSCGGVCKAAGYACRDQ